MTEAIEPSWLEDELKDNSGTNPESAFESTIQLERRAAKNIKQLHEKFIADSRLKPGNEIVETKPDHLRSTQEIFEAQRVEKLKKKKINRF